MKILTTPKAAKVLLWLSNIMIGYSMADLFYSAFKTNEPLLALFVVWQLSCIFCCQIGVYRFSEKSALASFFYYTFNPLCAWRDYKQQKKLIEEIAAIDPIFAEKNPLEALPISFLKSVKKDIEDRKTK